MDSPPLTTQTRRRPRRRAYVETYGCQMNISDGELMQGVLAGSGYDLVDRPEDADVILVNTCAIREHAEQRVLGRVAQLNALKAEHPDLIIGVTGCMAQRMGEALLDRAPYVDLVMGPDGYRSLPDILARVRSDFGSSLAQARGAVAADASVSGGATQAGERPSSEPNARQQRSLPVLPATALELLPHENFEGLDVRRRSRITAWVPVQRGCDHRCTFCIVPYVRGPEKNRDPARVLDEVRAIAEQGIPEVTLLGQTVNSYRHGDWDFARLLRAVARVDGIRRVRFTSPHPGDVTPALVEVMATEPAVCRQLHLPVQSGHDRTLRRMLRRYSVASYLETVRQVRDGVPGIALSTDVIVAFPGETEEEYEATLDLMTRVRFDDAYLYRYSPREGTPATRLPAGDFLPDDVAQARLERLITLQREIQAGINRREVGRVVEVLVEREARSAGDVLGRTGTNKVVAFAGATELVGRFVDVRLTGTTGATFTGERVHSPEPVGTAA